MIRVGPVAKCFVFCIIMLTILSVVTAGVFMFLTYTIEPARSWLRVILAIVIAPIAVGGAFVIRSLAADRFSEGWAGD